MADELREYTVDISQLQSLVNQQLTVNEDDFDGLEPGNAMIVGFKWDGKGSPVIVTVRKGIALEYKYTTAGMFQVYETSCFAPLGMKRIPERWRRSTRKRWD